jgi:hypothetical protein
VEELYRHDPKVVVPYLLNMVRSTDPTVRYCCYNVCGRARWPDLLAYAFADKDSDALPYLFQGDRIETLGSSAEGYLQLFEFDSALSRRMTKPAQPATARR